MAVFLFFLTETVHCMCITDAMVTNFGVYFQFEDLVLQPEICFYPLVVAFVSVIYH